MSARGARAFAGRGRLRRLCVIGFFLSNYFHRARLLKPFGSKYANVRTALIYRKRQQINIARIVLHVSKQFPEMTYFISRRMSLESAIVRARHLLLRNKYGI